MKLYRHILLVLAALTGAAAMCVSCSAGIYDYYDVEPDEQAQALLVLRVGLTSPTRAGQSIENMHSLRVVLVDQAGVVEYNDFISGSEYFGADGTDALNYGDRYRVIPTTPGKKRIYLIANEESVDATLGGAAFGFAESGTHPLGKVLSSRGEGAADFEQMVQSLYFVPDFSRDIVISSMYEFEVEQGRNEKTFYMVRAATKFEFSFENSRSVPMTIDALTLSAVTDSMFLLAKPAGEEMEKSLPDGEKKYWVDWLKYVCDDTTARPGLPENKDINARYGWISDYSLPATASHSAADVKAAVGSAVNWTIDAGGSLTLPHVYYPESRWGGDNQRYTITVGLSDGKGESRMFEPSELNNLKALFRNTFALVTVRISDGEEDIQLILKIGICPWYEADIDIPTFD